MHVAFSVADAGASPAAELIAAMVAELARAYDDVRPDDPRRPTATPAELGPPHGTCRVGWADGVPVVVGGVKRLGDGLRELKRMYVAPAARGRGVARMLLAALEDAARELGYARARLDTGPRQPHAEALYRSAGYAEIAPYNENPAASFWGKKAL